MLTLVAWECKLIATQSRLSNYQRVLLQYGHHGDFSPRTESAGLDGHEPAVSRLGLELRGSDRVGGGETADSGGAIADERGLRAGGQRVSDYVYDRLRSGRKAGRSARIPPHVHRD